MLEHADKYLLLRYKYVEPKGTSREILTKIASENKILQKYLLKSFASARSYRFHETTIVKKAKAHNFQNSFCPHSHIWS